MYLCSGSKTHTILNSYLCECVKVRGSHKKVEKKEHASYVTCHGCVLYFRDRLYLELLSLRQVAVQLVCFEMATKMEIFK